jgi:hypothetical protein
MICYFADSVIFSPNVLPLSLLILSSGSLLVAFLSHQLTYKSLPAAAIPTLIESVAGELLRLTLGPNVLPLLFEALNITSPLLFGVPLSVNHTMYTSSPTVAMGALRSISPVKTKAYDGCICTDNGGSKVATPTSIIAVAVVTAAIRVIIRDPPFFIYHLIHSWHCLIALLLGQSFYHHHYLLSLQVHS